MPVEGFTLGREPATGHPALTDSVTGLANRLHFELVYRYLFLAGDRGMAFAVLLLTVDGAPAEDEATLRAVGEAVHKTTRVSDLIARVDDRRFAVLLIGTNLPGARIAADRIEGALRALPGAVVSAGVSAYTPDLTDPASLLDAAEKARATASANGGGVEMAVGVDRAG